MIGLVLFAVGTFGTLVADATDAGVPATASDRIAAPASALLAPASSKTGRSARALEEYRLRRADDGTDDLVYEGDGFTARVAPDGSVRFRDRHFGIQALPLWLGIGRVPPPQPAVPSLQAILSRLKGPPPPPRSDEEVAESSTRYGSRLPIPEVTPFRPDPREACQYPSPCFPQAAVVVVSVKLTFDVSDELMRMSGQDPYRFDKARFLAGTRELRAQLGARAHAADLRRSMLDLPTRVQAIACDSIRSVAERRALLQALRAELDATTPEGRAAAEVIDRRLGDGSADGIPCH